MTTFAGTSTSTTPGVSSATSGTNAHAISSTTSGSAHAASLSASSTGSALDVSTTGGGIAVGVSALANDALQAHSYGNSRNGVYGAAAGNSGVGVRGEATGLGFGMWGDGGSGYHGVVGAAGSLTDQACAGVYGYSLSSTTNSYGVIGINNYNVGVQGTSNTGTLGQGTGVVGTADAGVGVMGTCSGSGVSAAATEGGVVGIGYGGAYGVAGWAADTVGGFFQGGLPSSAGGAGVGVFGSSATNNGVMGEANSGTTGAGLYGLGSPSVLGDVFSSPSETAGIFYGEVYIFSNFYASGSKSFRIDHPLDPANKYLQHASVESPDVKNLYDGVCIADANGEASVTMPEYFDALNGDVRYQLTAIGAPAPNLHIKQELTNRQFTIGGAGSGQKIAWQITGIRRDAVIAANPMTVELAKPPAEKGLYINPQLHGQPDSKGLAWERRQNAQAVRERLKRQPSSVRASFKSEVTFPTGSITPVTPPKPA